MDYHEFRSQYEAQHPASVPVLRYELSVYARWVKWAVLAMFLAAALISGVHTVPTVYQTIEAAKVAPLVHDIAAMSSFVAVELAILLSAYLLIRNPWLGWALLIVTSFVAAVANLQSSMSALAGKDDWTRLVAVVMGLAAPLIVLASGKLLVVIFNSERTISGRAEERFREECKAFDSEVLGAFEKFTRTSKRSQPDRIAVQSVHSLNSVNGSVNEPLKLPYAANSANGYTKRMDARTIITQYFNEHPEDLHTRLDELVEKIVQQTGVKVGRTSVHNIRSERMTQSPSESGVNGGETQ